MFTLKDKCYSGPFSSKLLIEVKEENPIFSFLKTMESWRCNPRQDIYTFPSKVQGASLLIDQEEFKNSKIRRLDGNFSTLLWYQPFFFYNLPAARVARTGYEQDEFCQELIMYLWLVRQNIPPYRSINYWSVLGMDSHCPQCLPMH